MINRQNDLLKCSLIDQETIICYIPVTKTSTLFDKKISSWITLLIAFLTSLFRKAVDQRVYHRTHENVKNSYNFALFYRSLGRRPQIHAEKCPIKDSDSCQVGPTGGEGSRPPFCRADMQNGSKDEDVGDEDDDERTHEVETSNYKHGSLFGISIWAGQD